MFDGTGIVGDTAHQVAGFMLGVIAQRQAMQLLEDFHAQDTQHVLSRPCHDEKRRTGDYRAQDKQRDHNQDETQQPCNALLVGRGQGIYNFKATEGISVVNDPAREG